MSKLERSKLTLDDHLKQVLIGNLLGDAYMRRFSNKSNTRIIFRQGSKNTEYLLHLYNVYKQFVLSPPAITSIVDKSSGKTRNNISFATVSLPCFNKFYDEFYMDGKKVIPANIAEYLTAVSLAYWIMDDGGYTGSGLKLYTNAFKLEDLNLLVDAINKNFSISVTIHKSSIEHQYTLYISKKQLPLVIELVKEYMHPSMLYKLNINNK